MFTYFSPRVAGNSLAEEVLYGNQRPRSESGISHLSRRYRCMCYAISVIAIFWFLVFPALIRFIKPPQTDL